MFSVPKIVMCAVCLGAAYYVNTTFLKPIEQRVDAMAKTADRVGLNKEQPDVEKVCGVPAAGMAMEDLEKINACYAAVLQNQLQKIVTVIESADLETLGQDWPSPGQKDDPCKQAQTPQAQDGHVAQRFMEFLRHNNPSEAHALMSRDLRERIAAEDTLAYIDKRFWRGKTLSGATSIGMSGSVVSSACNGEASAPTTNVTFTLNGEVIVEAIVETINEDGVQKISVIRPVEQNAAATTSP
jgi:hypothetical protein